MSMLDTDRGESKKVLGTRRLRKEDPELLTGKGRYTDDLIIPGSLYLGIVRSPLAHARIKEIYAQPVRDMEGVVAVLSGNDLAGEWVLPMPCAWPVTADMKNPEHYPLAKEEVHYQGEPVCVVVASSKAVAEDAAAAVMVDYEELTPVLDLEEASEDKVLAHQSLGTNHSYTWTLDPDPDGVKRAFEKAHVVVSERYIQQRLIPSAIEPRSIAVVPSPTGDGFTVYSATQIPHILKLMLSLVTGIPETMLRVVAPKVGGGFGSKLDVYAEELLCLALARKFGVPVRYTETRSEATVATIHGRGQIQKIELAADSNGKVTAVRVDLLADMGAYLQLVTPGIPLLGAFLYHGVYDIENYSFRCTGLFTNKTPTDAYRGAGRPEATFAIERAMDTLARKLGLDPAELRRRNYIAKEKFPYESKPGLVFDSGDYETNLSKALEISGYEELRKEQARRRQEGDKKRLGIGISSYVEMCGLAPSRVLGSLNYGAGGWEAATVRVLPTGKVQVVTGTAPHGQGHETSWSMIVAERLSVPIEDVEVLHSDTLVAPLGMDTYGSRSLSVGGTAVHLATEKVLDKALRIAAHQLEVAEEDLEFRDGAFKVKGSPGKEIGLAQIAFEAFSAHNLPDGMEPNLEASISWDPPNFTFPFGNHIAVVEIDEETGAVELKSYFAVDDCGNQVNPMIVEGQVHGGVVQGIAQALFEEAVYDNSGTLVSASLADYLVPSAAEVPSFTLANTVTPSPTNPLGVKGVGEAGTIAATPAVINAVVDALSDLGVTDCPMPATPERVWRLIEQARVKN
jgi:carbon-monoxide dehydrogenase large subunit